MSLHADLRVLSSNSLERQCGVQGSPLARPFGVFVERAQVNVLGLVPSIAKAWRASDCMKVLPGPFFHQEFRSLKQYCVDNRIRS